MVASAVPGVAAAGAAYADMSSQMDLMDAKFTALASAVTSITSTVSTLSTSSTCLLSKVCLLHMLTFQEKNVKLKFFQVKEITTVTRTAITGTTSYSDLTVTSAATTIPDFTTTTDKNTGESLILMNRNFIKSMEDISDPSCS